MEQLHQDDAGRSKFKPGDGKPRSPLFTMIIALQNGELVLLEKGCVLMLV
jgi:hypothetical protein